MLNVIPVKCDSCGRMVSSFSNKSEWFGKYLKDNEERICYKCIKDRPGYAKELLEKTGVAVEQLGVNKGDNPMTVKKIKYFVTRFYPDENGFFELPEGSLLSLISDDYVTALVPTKE